MGASTDARRWAEWLLLSLLVLAMILAAWPASGTAPPAPGLALSWRAALHEAARLGLTFGTDIAFTYGPFGYLGIPRFFDAHTGTMAVITMVVLLAGFAASATVVTRSRSGLALTIVTVVIASRLASTFDPMLGPVLAVVAWASWLAYRSFPSPATTLAIVAGSVLGAVMILMKFNTGVTILAIVAVLAFTTTRRHPWHIPVMFLATVATLVAAWLIGGQDGFALPTFLIGSWELASGYSEAMPLPTPPWQILAAAVALGAVLLGVHLSSRDLGRSQRVGLTLAVAVTLFFAWKYGIVRQGLDGYFAEVVVIGLLAIDWRGVDPRARLVAVVLPAVFYTLASPFPPAALDWGRSVDVAKGQISTALLPGAADVAAQQVRATLRSGYALPPVILDSVAGRTTHIEGWHTAVAVAYPEMPWRPLPVFQSYAVFTPYLDAMNARSLSADDGPERILRQRPSGIDQRYWLFDGPQTTLTMLCRYYETAATMFWEVLARGEDRCGSEQAISTVTALEGVPVPVPPPDAPSVLIGVRVTGVADGIADSIRSTLYRGSIWRVELDGRPYRLVPGTASGPLLLGTNADLGYAFGFGISRNVRQISIEDEDGGPASELTYSFFRVPVIGASAGGS